MYGNTTIDGPKMVLNEKSKRWTFILVMGEVDAYFFRKCILNISIRYLHLTHFNIPVTFSKARHSLGERTGLCGYLIEVFEMMELDSRWLIQIHNKTVDGFF